MWCCSKGPQPPKQTTPKSKTNAIQRPSDAKPARNPHPSNPPQPAAAAGDQPPPDLSGYNNAPVQVHAQSSLMQSYALPAQPVDSVGYFPGVAVTVATGNGLPAPREHVFVAKTNDTYLHLQASPTSPTGWEPSELTGLRKISTWTAGFYDGNVLLFALTGQQAWKRTAEAKVGGMQSFATSEWVSLGEIPGTAAYPAISFADGQLWVSCTPNDYSSGRLFLLPWQTPGAPWDVMSTTPQPLWTCSASTSGCYVGGYDSSRNYQYIEFYPTDKSAPLSTAEGGAEGANKLMGSTLGGGAVYCLDNGGVLSRRDMTSSNVDLVANGVPGGGFSVVRHNGSTTSEAVFYTQGSRDTTSLWMATYDSELPAGKRVTAPLQMASGVNLVCGASVSTYSSMFYTMYSGGGLKQMDETSGASYKHMQVTVRKELVGDVPTASSLFVPGRHGDQPVLFNVSHPSGAVREYWQNVAVSHLQSIWNFTDRSMSNNAIRLASATGPGGRLSVFGIDAALNVQHLQLGAVGGEQWTGLGQLTGQWPGLQGGVIGGELVLLVYKSDNTGAGVYHVPLDGGDWVEATPFDYSFVNDVSFGKTSAGEGFFVARSTANGDNGVDFFLLGNTAPVQTYGYQGKYALGQVRAAAPGLDHCYMVDSVGNFFVATAGAAAQGTTLQTKVADVEVTRVWGDGPDEPDTTAQLWFVKLDGTAGKQLFPASQQPGEYTPIAKGLQAIRPVGRLCVYALDAGGLMRDLVEGKMCASYEGDLVEAQPAPADGAAAEDPEEQAPTEFQAWQTTFQTEDKNRTPVPDTTVYFEPVDEDLQVLINGKLVTMSPGGQPMEVKTNSRGVVTITSVATSLHAPVLSMYTNYHPESSTSAVVGNYEQQLYLSAVPEDQLQNAKKNNGEPLFSDPSVANTQFTDALHASIAPALPDEDADPEAAAQVHRHGARRGRLHRGLFAARRGQAGRYRRLNPRVCRETCFHTEYTCDPVTGRRGVRFNKGTPAEMDAVCAQLRDEPDWTPYMGTYADVMQSANAGYSDVMHTVFKDGSPAVADGLWGKLKALVKFVAKVAGKLTTFIWEGVLEFAEDVVHASQSLFSHVKVFFSDMVQWLSSFFNWQDILNTQQFLLQTMKAFAETAEGKFDVAQSVVAAKLDTLADKLAGASDSRTKSKTADEGMAEANTEIDKNGDPGPAVRALGDDVVDENGEDASPEKTTYGNDPQGNWLMDQLMDALAVLGPTSLMTDWNEGLLDLQDELSAALEAATGDIAASLNETMEASTVVGEKGTSTSVGDVFQNVLRALGQAVVNGLSTVATTLFGIAAKLLRGTLKHLDRPVQIPLLSNLYSNVITNGQPLSLLGAVMLAIAAPLTLGYKAFTMVKMRKMVAPVVSTTSLIVYPKAQVALDMIDDIVNHFGRTARRAQRSCEAGGAADAVEGDDVDIFDPLLVASWIFGGAYTTAQVYMSAMDIGQFLLATAKPVWGGIDVVTMPAPAIKFPLDTSSMFDPLEVVRLNMEFSKQVGVVLSIVGSFPITLVNGEASDTDIGLEIATWAVGAAIYTVELSKISNRMQKPVGTTSVSRGSAIQSLLGAAHCAFIGVLAEREYKALEAAGELDGVDLAAWALKITQNGLAGLGELTIPLPEMVFKKYEKNKNTETLKAASVAFGLHQGLALLLPGVVGGARMILEAANMRPFQVF